MRRLEFMKNLEQQLQDITQSEREEALRYYNDYLDDAGLENEEEVLAALGSPEELAKSIREGLKEESREEGEFDEQGFRNEERAMDEVLKTDHFSDRKKVEDDRNGTDYDRRYRAKDGKKVNGSTLMLIFILGVFALPLIVPVCIGIVAAVFGIFVGAAALLLGLLVTGIALVIAGAALVVVGIIKLFGLPFVGAALAGVGFLLAGIGMLLSWVMGWLFLKGIPVLCRLIVKLCKMPFDKKRSAAV